MPNDMVQPPFLSRYEVPDEIDEYGVSVLVDLFGLIGVISDIEMRGAWALIKIIVNSYWEGSIMVELDCDPPEWLAKGARIKITENGLQLIKRGPKAKIFYKARILQDAQ